MHKTDVFTVLHTSNKISSPENNDIILCTTPQNISTPPSPYNCLYTMYKSFFFFTWQVYMYRINFFFVSCHCYERIV